jgi:hypothetical protein
MHNNTLLRNEYHLTFIEEVPCRALGAVLWNTLRTYISFLVYNCQGKVNVQCRSLSGLPTIVFNANIPCKHKTVR